MKRTIIIFLFLFLQSTAFAASYYVSPSGAGSTCSSNSPCTLATGLGKSLVDDDQLVLKNGTYTGISLTVPWSGTSGHPIIIKAENEGQAIVDGNNITIPLNIVGTSGSHKTDITVEGIVFKNSSDSVVRVKYADRITLRRVSAYNAPATGNVHVFDLWYVTRSLFEDCAASGYGRVMYNVLDSSYVTLRRCWGAAVYNPDGSDVVQIYGSSNCIVENCVGTIASPSAISAGVYLQNKHYNAPGNNNKIYGNVMRNMVWATFLIQSEQHNIHGNEFKNNVGIGNIGVYQLGDSNFAFTNNTILSGDARGGYYIHSWIDSGYVLDADWYINSTVKNNVFKNNGSYEYGIYVSNTSRIQSFTHTYNDISGFETTYWNTTAGTGEVTTTPTFNTATYGDGAYLMYPTNLTAAGEGGTSMGAKVLYRYVDGAITTDALWPWPMEDRIMNETGISVTYESGGGIWKTLDGVYVGLPPSPLSKLNWSLLYVDSQETVGEDGKAINAFDGYNNTFWHSQWYGASPEHPHEIQINLGGSYNISQFKYLPRQDGEVNGTIAGYEFYTSTDASNWTLQASGTWASTTTEKTVSFTTATARHVKLKTISEINSNAWASVAEISIIGTLDSVPAPTYGSIVGSIGIVVGGTSTIGMATGITGAIGVVVGISSPYGVGFGAGTDSTNETYTGAFGTIW